MKSNRLIWVAMAAIAFVAVPVADAAGFKDIPNIDLQSRCKRSERAMAAMMGASAQPGRDFESCLRAEQEARKAIEAAWPDIPASYKSFCINPTAYSPSYIEWIACLEMLIDLRKLRAAKPQ
jgi:hypothetical protein